MKYWWILLLLSVTLAAQVRKEKIYQRRLSITTRFNFSKYRRQSIVNCAQGICKQVNVPFSVTATFRKCDWKKLINCRPTLTGTAVRGSAKTLLQQLLSPHGYQIQISKRGVNITPIHFVAKRRKGSRNSSGNKKYGRQLSGVGEGKDPWRFKSARDMYRVAATRDYDRRGARLLKLVDSSLRAGKLPEAERLWEQLRQLDPYRQANVVQEQIQLWADICRQKINSEIASGTNKTAATSLRTAANVYYKNQAFTTAVDKYRQALRAWPQYLDARNNLALAEMRLGHDLPAQLQLEITCRLSSKYVPAAVNLTVIYERLNLRSKAEKLAVSTWKKNRQVAIAIFNAAWYANLRGKYAQANKLLHPLYEFEIDKKYTRFYQLNHKQMLAAAKTAPAPKTTAPLRITRTKPSKPGVKKQQKRSATPRSQPPAKVAKDKPKPRSQPAAKIAKDKPDTPATPAALPPIEKKPRQQLSPTEEKMGRDAHAFVTAEQMYQTAPSKDYDTKAAGLVETITAKLRGNSSCEVQEVWERLERLNPYRKTQVVSFHLLLWVKLCAAKAQKKCQLDAKAGQIITTANQYYKQGRLTGAATCYRKLLQQHPGHLDARNNLALTQLHLNQDLRAQLELEIIRKIAPNYLPALVNLTVVYERLGERKKARELLKLMSGKCQDSPKKKAKQKYTVDRDIVQSGFNRSWYLNFDRQFAKAEKLLKPLAALPVQKYRDFYRLNARQKTASEKKPAPTPAPKKQPPPARSTKKTPAASKADKTGLAGKYGGKSSSLGWVVSSAIFAVIVLVCLAIAAGVGQTASDKQSAGFWIFFIVAGIATIVFWGMPGGGWWGGFIFFYSSAARLPVKLPIHNADEEIKCVGFLFDRFINHLIMTLRCRNLWAWNIWLLPGVSLEIGY